MTERKTRFNELPDEHNISLLADAPYVGVEWPLASNGQ